VSELQPLVSVIIPAFNCASFIGDALTSVFDQSYAHVEILVIDDGSTDETPHIVQGRPGVRYFRQGNRGPSVARNAGVSAAAGDYIAFLDADDLWTPDKLARQVSLLQQFPEAAFAFADMRLISQENRTEPSMFEKYCLNEEFFGHPSRVINAPAKLVWSNFIPTSTVLVRKRAVQAAGGFDVAFRKCEDWDLWLRMALRAPIVYSPELLMLKRMHDVNASRDATGMNVAAMQVLEKLDRHHHTVLLQLGVDITRALRDGYRNLGYFYLRQIQLAQARTAFGKSLQRGFQVRSLIYFAATLLGQRFVGSVVRARG